MLLLALKYFLERKLARRRAFDRIHRELSYSTDRELADMGLGRGDVGPIARQAGRDAEAAALKNQVAKDLAKAKETYVPTAPPHTYY